MVASPFYCSKESLRRLADSGAAADTGKEKSRQQKNSQQSQRRKNYGADGDAPGGLYVASHFGEVAAKDVGAAGDGVVGFVDCVAAEDDGVSADSRLGVDDGVAADDGGAALDAAGYVQVPEEDEGASGQIAFNLHGAEDADGVVHLLSGGDEDILSEVDAVASRLGMCGGGKQDRETENPSYTGQQGSPSGKDACRWYAGCGASVPHLPLENKKLNAASVGVDRKLVTAATDEMDDQPDDADENDQRSKGHQQPETAGHDCPGAVNHGV